VLKLILGVKIEVPTYGDSHGESWKSIYPLAVNGEGYLYILYVFTFPF